MATGTTKPEVIHGGCLCEGVRYKITFPPDHDFVKSVKPPLPPSPPSYTG